jgi:hypothetical protein
MDMVRLNRQREDIPTPLGTLARDQLPAPLGHRSHQHRLAPPGAPDQMVDDEVDAVFIPSVLVCLIHGVF